LHPAPANLAEHDYSLSRLSFVLTNGIDGTSMPAWRDFSPGELSVVAQVVRGFHVAQPEPEIPKAVLDLGARVYSENCAQCHGVNGGGDGTAVSELHIVPANLRGERPSLSESLRVLRNGIDGTQMAPWTGRLSEAELSAVAYYVRGFYQPDQAGGVR
jgi:mono/diheme cytochrome c family protein